MATLSTLRDDHPVINESKIVTHDEAAARDRTNYILRLDLTTDGQPGCFEQMWTRTDDQQQFELCCIPFFTYGLSLGDVISVDASRAYTVVSKNGHQTIRIAIQDEAFAHEHHEDFHGALVRLGMLIEFRGHANGYCAVDISDQTQADALIEMLQPLVTAGTLVWEWADPVEPGRPPAAW